MCYAESIKRVSKVNKVKSVTAHVQEPIIVDIAKILGKQKKSTIFREYNLENLPDLIDSDELLIAEVQKRPALYDCMLGLQEQSRKRIEDLLWAEVAIAISKYYILIYFYTYRNINIRY